MWRLFGADLEVAGGGWWFATLPAFSEPDRPAEYALEEVRHQMCDLVDFLVEREMAGVEEAYFGVRQIPFVGFGAGRRTPSIVT